MENMFDNMKSYLHAAEIVNKNELGIIRIEKRDDGDIELECSSDYYGVITGIGILIKEVSKSIKHPKQLFKELETVVNVLKMMDTFKKERMEKDSSETSEEDLKELYKMMKNIKKKGK